MGVDTQEQTSKPKAKKAAKPKAAKKERKPRGIAASTKPVGYVTPGIGFVAATVFDQGGRAREVLGMVQEAMQKAKGAGTVDVSNLATLSGDVQGLTVIARIAAEPKTLQAARWAVRDAAQEAFREAGFVVRR